MTVSKLPDCCRIVNQVQDLELQEVIHRTSDELEELHTDEHEGISADDV